MKCGNSFCTKYSSLAAHGCLYWNQMLSQNCGFFEERSCSCNPCTADQDCPKYDVNPCSEIDFKIGKPEVPIEIRIEDIEIYIEEYEFMEWMMQNLDFGPAHGDVMAELREQYKKETKKKVPESWKY